MMSDRIAAYVDKVYAYAVKKTFSDEEAAELSQEILYTAVRELPRLRDESRFEPWLWSLAQNVAKSFRRKQGKQRAMFSYDIPEDLAYEEDTDSENEELYALLRRKIAMLSAIYREIILLYYYDGLSTKQISEHLKIPEGTVTWRLSEARNKLKKECSTMEDFTLKPVKLRIDIYGSGNFGCDVPFPDVYINDALSQNILYFCYEEAQSIEEISKLCGVPAYYVEDRIENLMKREAVVRAGKDKYRTDFIIWSDKYGIYCEQTAEKALMPIMDKLLLALKSIAAEAGGINFYQAGKSAADLFFLYGILAFETERKKFCRLPYPEIKEKYDGNAWCYLGNMETGAHKRIKLTTLHCGNEGVRGRYTHTVYCGFAGLPRREMMFNKQIDACIDILRTGHSDDRDATALAVQQGYLQRKEDGSLFVTAPAFTDEQMTQFEQIVERHLSALMDDYSALAEKWIAGYKKLFPKHLSDDADRMCYSMFKDLYSVIADYAVRTGAAAAPTPGSYCDVLLQIR